MAILIILLIFSLFFLVTFVLYACIVVGKSSKTKKEIEYENSAELAYIKKCMEVKKQNKKNKFRDKKDKIIYL